MSDWNPQANSIFLRAIDIPSPLERGEYLDEACGEDANLRALVETLLLASEQAGSFLESATTGLDPSTVQPDGEEAGTVIGPYRLVEQIGEGGMGSVFLAEQTEPVQRQVALKIIKPGMDSRQVIARFEAERQALALMDHPSIARVLDAGTTASGRPYFVMELVKGVPITRYCDEHKLTPKERLELFVPVCQAVQHAHTKGIIHRDLKPSNILVTLYDGRPVPKVIDFGIAKATSPTQAARTMHTEVGQIVGTLEYMSPEQAEANPLDIDTRSDVYSLGVLLYELLTGTTPLERKQLREAAFLEVLRLIREEEPPRPSTRLSTTEEFASIAANRGLEPKQLSGQVRGELDWIVMKALEKDRSRRYETANGFAADVQRYLADEPVAACPPSKPYRLKKFLRRHRGPVLAAAIVLLALLGGIVGTTVGLVRAETAKGNERAERRDKEEALVARLTEEEDKNEAKRQRILALDGETKALKGWRQTAYYNWVQLAHNEYRGNNVARADEMLHSGKKCPRDLCGFEWHFLQRLCHSELSRFSTAEGPAGLLPRWCRFSPDARSVVLFERESRTLHVYDTTTGKETCLLSIGFDFNDVTFSQDGKRLALCPSGPPQDTLHVWDTATRRKCAILNGPKARYPLGLGFSGAALSNDGRLVTAADQIGNLFVWDLHTAEESFRIWPARFIVQSIAAVPLPPPAALLSMAGAVANAKPDAFALRLQIAAHTDDKARPNQHWSMTTAFTPDSKLVATASQGDQTVKLWNSESGKLVRDLGKGPDCVRVAFSANGTRLAVAGGEASGLGRELGVWVWDTKSGQTLCVIRGQTKAINCLAFTPDERFLATGSHDGTLTAWDIETGREIVTYRGHDRGVHALAYTPDGKRLLAVGDDRVVRTWDAKRHPERRLLQCRGAWHAAFNSDGRIVAAAARHVSGSYWGTVVWDAETGAELAKFGNQEESPYAVALSPDGRIVAAATDIGHTTGVVRLWDVGTGQQVRKRSEANFLGQVILAAAPVGPAGPLGSSLVTLGALEGMKWNALSLVRSLPEQGLAGPFYAVAWSPDGKRIAAGGQDRMVHIWDAVTGKQLLKLVAHARTISALVFSRDGNRLVSASGGITQKGGNPTAPLKLPLDGPDEIPDVKVWDVATGKELRSWSLPGKGPGLALSPDGETVAVTVGETGMSLLLTFEIGGGASGMVFTDAAHSPGVVRLYRVATGAMVAELKGHTRPPWCVAFSPDGKRLVTGGGADETIKLWDADTGEEILLVGRHPGIVTSVAFSQDGMKIVSTSNGSPIRVWDATPIPHK